MLIPLDFSFSDILDGCQTTASIYWVLFVAFFNTSGSFFPFFPGECLLLRLLNSENKSMKVTEAHLIMSITFGHVGCLFLDQ